MPVVTCTVSLSSQGRFLGSYSSIIALQMSIQRCKAHQIILTPCLHGLVGKLTGCCSLAYICVHAVRCLTVCPEDWIGQATQLGSTSCLCCCIAPLRGYSRHAVHGCGSSNVKLCSCGCQLPHVIVQSNILTWLNKTITSAPLPSRTVNHQHCFNSHIQATVSIRRCAATNDDRNAVSILTAMVKLVYDCHL